jgi:DNA-binding transcriptional LysR family regulator
MRLSGFDLNLLVAFEALYEEQSVTTAAQRLGLGQPALSAALSRLRGLLGDPLFERVADRMVPTPTARELAPKLLGSLGDLRRTIGEHNSFDPATTTRTFSAASTDYTSHVVLPRLMGLMRKAAPCARLRVLSYEKDRVPDLLERGEADVVLGTFSEPPPKAVSTILMDEQFVGVARAGHPAVFAGRISLEDYAAFPHALVTVRRDAAGAIDDALAAAGHSRQVALTLPHMLALPGILAASDLVAALPARLGGSMPVEVQLFELPLQVPRWQVCMLWTAALRTDKALAWLRDLVVQATKDDLFG